MILDAHTHIGKKTIVASAEDLIRSMDNAGIDKALVFAGKIAEQATGILLQDITPFKGRLYGIGSITPFDKQGNYILPNEETYLYLDDLLSKQEIFGLKFYVGYEHYYPNDPALKSIYNLLIKHNRPAIFHTGDCYNGVCGAKLKYAHPLNIDDLAVDYPELKIVIAHMGYPWVRDAALVCYKNKNVYADMSGFVYGKFNRTDFSSYKDEIYEFHQICGGPHKLIFGSDWPISDQKSYVDTLYSQGFASAEEMAEIMGNRAAKLFGIV